ncbi:MAG TPA: DUF2911 domain-containing protein [Phnomibacter sp.]|nr:DUF2911 domain-containing protein [Phnomibacter sp.]
MNRVCLVILFALFTCTGFSQLQITEPDKSPLDVAYHPHGYPILKFQSSSAPALPLARVFYSRPQKNGRVIFGDIVKYNEIWRLGANESTEIEFFKEATVGKIKVPKGRYSLFCVPQAGSWTIVLNNGLYSWGTFSYDKKLDRMRTDVAVSKIETPVEYFTMAFDAAGNLMVMWDTVKVVIPIKYAAK